MLPGDPDHPAAPDPGGAADVAGTTAAADIAELSRRASDDVPPPMPWTVGVALGGWALAFVAAAIAGSVVFAAKGPDALFELFLASSLALWSTSLAWCAWVSRTRGTGRMADDYRLRPRSPGQVIAGLGLGVAAAVVINTALSLAYSLVDEDLLDRVGQSTAELAEASEGWRFLVLAAGVVIGAPLVEELVFRGLLLDALRRRLAPVAAIGVSSALFGVAHLQLLELPGLVAIGLVLGAVKVRTGRLAPAIACHAGFNLLAAVSLFLAQR